MDGASRCRIRQTKRRIVAAQFLRDLGERGDEPAGRDPDDEPALGPGVARWSWPRSRRSKRPRPRTAPGGSRDFERSRPYRRETGASFRADSRRPTRSKARCRELAELSLGAASRAREEQGHDGGHDPGHRHGDVDSLPEARDGGVLLVGGGRPVPELLFVLEAATTAPGGRGAEV